MRVDDLPVVDTEVLVVGAGPTGLMAGVVLNRRGVPAVVADRKAGPIRESRALAVQARTMEVYDQLGVADTVLEKAYPASRIQVGGSGGGGPDLVALQDGATRFPGIQIFEQSRNEEVLVAALTAGNGDIQWRHRLIDLVDHTATPGGRVEALLEDAAGGLLRIRARWCIGADGTASAVRRELNLPFEGTTDEATFWVADVRDVSGVPDQALNFRPGKRTFAAVFPLGPEGHVRLLGLADKDAITEDEALATVRAEFGLTHGTVEWFSTYRVHHRVAARFRVGSVFLAGDAARVHSPVGGQGMNTGLQDAHNLAVPARFAAPARKPMLHVPAHWAWQAGWTALWDNVIGLLDRATPRRLTRPVSPCPPCHPRPDPTRGPRNRKSWYKPADHACAHARHSAAFQGNHADGTSMSTNIRSSAPASSGVRAASATRCARATAASWLACPKVNSRKKIPNVDGAYTSSNTRGVPPARSTLPSSMLSAPQAIAAMIEVSLPTGFTAPERTRVDGRSTCSPINSESPVRSASSAPEPIPQPTADSVRRRPPSPP
ncbi:hypothetical protein MDOR_17110 [Mycolicibacterium doricum]|uniref:FAD-binding domain-containing protein n=1 Tax=Mycolicibacterium doricum TaxID=126673 RepID=A0A7I7VSD4_9MYCO|nr:FAD-dependent monooxygenase [Mycolicibacterium doricum]BBZ07542.1 hypothetical protein MDOR_17110 [Mycolicibacterium doricum]